MKSGVYAIESNHGKQYVGSSIYLKARWSQHKSALRKGTHHSPYLQKSWNKYGEEFFTFRVLEYCKIDMCIEREQYWMDTLNPVYNVLSIAGSAPGSKITGEKRDKLIRRLQQYRGAMTGRKHTDESKDLMSRIKALKRIHKCLNGLDKTKSKSGIMYVTYDPGLTDRWRVNIRINRRQHNVGYFKTIYEARCARNEYLANLLQEMSEQE